METDPAVAQRLTEIERQINALAYVTANVVRLLGAINATLGRLSAQTAGEPLYNQRFNALDAEIFALIEIIAKDWPPEGWPDIAKRF